MNAAAQKLWDYIETNLMGSKNTATDWANTLDYGVTVHEGDVNEIAREKFGGYDTPISFRNGTTQYRMKILPLQNKNTRDHHAYGSVRGGGENKINVVAWPAGGGGNVFNLHVQVRKDAYVVTTTVDEDGFVSKVRGGRKP